MAVRFSVTIRQVREDGSEVPLEGELAAALAAPAEQFAGLAAWAAEEAGYLDHGEREKVIGAEGRELQRRLLQATFDIDGAREQRAGLVTSAAGIRHGIVEEGHGRGVTSVFGPVRVTRKAYRNRREPNLYPADARLVLPGDPYSLGMRAWRPSTWPPAGSGRPRRSSRPAPASPSAAPELTGLAEDLAAWTDDFYAGRSRDAEEEEQPDSDVIMMQADGKGIAMRRSTARAAAPIPRTPGSRRWPRSSPSRTSPRRPRARGHRRPARPPQGAPRPRRAGQVGVGVGDREHRGHDRRSLLRGRPPRPGAGPAAGFLVDGNKQQITAIGARAAERGLKVPVLIDYIHVSGYIGKAAAALHPGDPAAAGQWADGQLLRVLHGRAKAVAATLAAVAARTCANPRTRHLDLTDVDKAVTYLENNREHMRYDKALEKGWPIATGMIEGACRFVIEDRFGITGARWSPTAPRSSSSSAPSSSTATSTTT